VAVKTLTKAKLSKADIRDFKREAGVSCALKHPNVVRCHGVYINPPKLGIVMEFCDKGDLFDALERLDRKRAFYGLDRAAGSGPAAPAASVGRALSQDGRGGGGSNSAAARAKREKDLVCPFDPMRLAHEVAAAMHYLQQSGVVHRDLKSLNVVLAQAGAPPQPKKRKTKQAPPAPAPASPPAPGARARAPSGEIVTNARGTRLTGDPSTGAGAPEESRRPALEVQTAPGSATASSTLANSRLAHMTAKLADFGDALLPNAGMSQIELALDGSRLHGTAAWAAPEALLRGAGVGALDVSQVAALAALPTDKVRLPPTCARTLLLLFPQPPVLLCRLTHPLPSIAAPLLLTPALALGPPGGRVLVRRSAVGAHHLEAAAPRGARAAAAAHRDHDQRAAAARGGGEGGERERTRARAGERFLPAAGLRRPAAGQRQPRRGRQ
jgi:serine/threonine protein kinase